MSYFLEIFLEEKTKDYLKSLSKKSEGYFPHVTLVRPFKPIKPEKEIINAISNYCKNFDPLPFVIEGRKMFFQGISYAQVYSKELSLFDSGLEKNLEGYVDFYKRLDPEKIHHVTVDFKNENDLCKKINGEMNCLVGIKNKKIWFSYDFLEKKILGREESLQRFKIKP